MEHNDKIVEKMLKTLKIKLEKAEQELEGKKLMKAIMRKWLDAS